MEEIAKIPIWDHLMIDLETLGNKPGCVITSIAAIPFNWNNKNVNAEDSFYRKINIQSALDLGLTVQGSTLEWWSNQDITAYREHFDQKDTMHIKLALYELRVYIQSLYPGTLQIWGNSNRFDLGILAYVYDLLKLEYPWKFMNERDVRTLSSLIPLIKQNHVFKGRKHNPVDDCLNQIDYLVETKASLKIII